MVETVQQQTLRRVARVHNEANYVATLNVHDRVTIHFVWYPGANAVNDVASSRVRTFVPHHPRTGARRDVYYTWERAGHQTIRRPVVVGRVTIPLPPNTQGTLTAFGTSWLISRAANGVNMAAVNSLRGIQQRLDRLGYHLRRPGGQSAGVDNALGRRTEMAILQFQCDYRPRPGAPAAASNRLQVRGEARTNNNAVYAGNLNRYKQSSSSISQNSNPFPNPAAISTADAAAFRAALRAVVGA